MKLIHQRCAQNLFNARIGTATTYRGESKFLNHWMKSRARCAFVTNCRASQKIFTNTSSSRRQTNFSKRLPSLWG
jgi:hypothetical protein